MKRNSVLICAAAAACIAAILWRKPPPPPVPAESAAPVAASKASPEKSAAPVHRSQASRTPVPPGDVLDAGSLVDQIALALASTNPMMRDIAYTNTLPMLVRVDPLAAMRLAETNSVEGTRELVLQKVAQLLAEENPTNALAWAAGLTINHEREVTLTDVCLQLAQSDPAEAVAIRAGYLTPDQSYDALEDLTQKWAEKDLSAALAWIKEHPADERRNQLLGRVAYLYSQTAPIDAARMVIEDMTPGESQNEAVMTVLHQWALRDLGAASSWVERFPESPLRQRAVLELAGIAGRQPQAGTP